MANRRMINKDDTEHASYFRLEIRQRYLFDHLMLYSDDDGIMPFALVKSKLFLADADINDQTIIDDLQLLEEKRFLIRYTCPDGEIYIAIQDWWRRQYIDVKLYKQTIYPQPPNYSARPIDLKRGPKARGILNSRINPIQSSKDETRRAHTRTDKTSVEDEVPWEADGSINPLYR